MSWRDRDWRWWAGELAGLAVGVPAVLAAGLLALALTILMSPLLVIAWIFREED